MNRLIRFLLTLTFLSCYSFNSAQENRDQFFPVEERWLYKMLDIKKELWKAESFSIEFRVRPNEKIWVKIKIHRNYFDFVDGWREEVSRYMEWLNPKIDNMVRKYASIEFLSVYQPDLDIEYFIYLEDSLYGVKKQGQLSWKRGIY